MRNGSGARQEQAKAPEWLTLGQAARFLGVAQSTIRKWSDASRVHAFYTPGGHRRFRRADLDAFLDRSRQGARARPGPHVLILDGDPNLRGDIRAGLEREGFSVQEAGSSEEGLAALDEQSPDLILLDVRMPEVDGRQLLSRVQERHGIGSIPVLMFSGGVDQDVSGDAGTRAERAHEPFDPLQLIESAKQMLAT